MFVCVCVCVYVSGCVREFVRASLYLYICMYVGVVIKIRLFRH